MFKITKKSVKWGGRDLTIETGKIARQADGAVLVTYGETQVLCTAVGVKENTNAYDFFPLTVHYIEKFYATGKILPKKETTITSVWGMGDIFTLKIEKNNTKKIKKVKEMQAKVLIYGDDFIFDKKNNSLQLKRLDEIIKINQNDFSLNFDSSDEKFFDGDISYTTSANNFGTTWLGLKVKKTDEVSHNIKIAFQIEEGSFPNFPEAFSISKNECGVFKDMVDDSFIIPLKTDDLFELELFDCYLKVLQENLNDDDFGILKNRINTAISLVDTIKITNKYF